MTRLPGQRPHRPRDPSELWIKDIPVFQLKELEAALSNFIYWHTHGCVTRADRMCRDHAYIRLRQAHWHLQDAVRNLGPEADRQPWWRKGWFGKRRQARAA